MQRLWPAYRGGRSTGSTESDLGTGLTYRADPSTSPFESERQLRGDVRQRRAWRCDVFGRRSLQTSHVGRHRDTRCSRTVRGGEPSRRRQSSRSAPSRREVLHSTPSAHVAVVSPLAHAPQKAKRGQQAAAPFERMQKAQRNFGCANPPCTAPVDGARRVVRRTDARTQMAWLPAMASLHGGGTSHLMFAMAFMGRRASDGQPSNARGGQGRRPRAGEDQRLADVPARPSSLQKLQFRASVSSKRNLSSHDFVVGTELRGRRLARRMQTARECGMCRTSEREALDRRPGG